MFRRLDALLGKNFKTSKFKKLINLTISRIASLNNRYQVRCSHARSDVITLLNFGHQERAVLHVEHVIRDRNMLDALAMIEGYCHLLMDRAVLIKNSKECPDELKEAISSLLFAASRCGELPELQKIRGVLTSRFGKRFASCAVELRNDCGVNPKIVKKLSTRRPSLGSKLKALKEMAPINEITEGQSSVINEEKLDFCQELKQPEPKNSTNPEDPQLEHDTQNLPEEATLEEKFHEAMKEENKYRDVTAAAEAAYKLAAHAAAAARAALKLSQSQFHDKGPDDHSSSINQQRSVSDLEKSLKSIVQVDGNTASKETNHWNKGFIKSEQGITEANIEKTLSSFSVEEVLDETGVKFIFQGPKGILLKSQADPIVYFGEGSSRLESTHHRSTAKELDWNHSNRGRKPVSMRTRRVDRR